MTSSHNLSSGSNSTLLLAQLELERRRREKARANPLVFRGAAAAAQTITDPEWIMSGPAETGKTFASMYRLHTLAMQYPKARFVIARKVRAWIYETAIQTWKRVIELGPMVPKAYGETKPYLYIYPNKSRVSIAGLDDSGSTLSGEFDGVYINQTEELGAEDWETLTSRTTGRSGIIQRPMLFGDCNPSYPDHWILQRQKAGSLTLLQSRHEDNPRLHDGTDWTEAGRYTISRLQAMTGPRYARLYLGEWVDADADEAFLPSMAMWDACAVTLPPLDEYTPMVLGVDAAISGDTFAVVGVTRLNDDQLAVRYVRVWEPNGTPLDFTDIETELRALIDRYNVVQVAYDPYQLHYFAQRLQDVVWCSAFNQQGDRLEADASLRTQIVQRRLYHDGSAPVLRTHLQNADAKVDDSGHKLRIIKRAAHLKIDAAVALSMAASRALSLNLY